MATRNPIQVLAKALSTTATDSDYLVQANSRLTISAGLLNCSGATPRTVTIRVTPSGGSALPVASVLPVPAAGAAPTTIPALVGQTLQAGDVIDFVQDTGTDVTLMLSGYLQQG